MTAEGAVLRWGILGAGAIAGTVGADIAASSGSRVVAVGARDLARARALADRLGAPRAYGSYADVTADADVDVVYVATTHTQHLDGALLALRMGKPVLVEKPLAVNARQAREIAAEAQARGLLCLEGMWLRLNPTACAVKAIVAAGDIGEILGVQADTSHAFDYCPRSRVFDPAVAGGTLLDGGIYPAAFAWMILGRPDSVRATGVTAPTGVDASVSMHWLYADGRFAQLTSSIVSEAGSFATVVGTAGWIRVDPPLYRTESLTVCTGGSTRTCRFPLPEGNGYGIEIAEVERLFAAGATDSPTMPLGDGIGVLELLDDARRQVGVHYAADGRTRPR